MSRKPYPTDLTGEQQSIIVSAEKLSGQIAPYLDMPPVQSLEFAF